LYTALGIPAIHYLIHRDGLKARFGAYSLAPSLIVIPIAILFYEGLWGCVILRVQSCNWRPEHLIWMKPWSNSLILEPLMLILPIFFANQAAEALKMTGFESPLPTWGGKGGATLVLVEKWTSFWLGFCTVQTGLYGMVAFVIAFLNWIQPWTAVRPIVF
jgi:hypothetical protein